MNSKKRGLFFLTRASWNHWKEQQQPNLIAEQPLKEKQIPQSKIISYGTFFATHAQIFKTLDRQLFLNYLRFYGHG